MFYEIEYEYDGNTYSCAEQPTPGWEDQFLQKVLNRIESLTFAGAVITSVIKVKG